MAIPPSAVHLLGESNEADNTSLSKPIEVDTFAGKVHVEWGPDCCCYADMLFRGACPVSLL